MTRSVIITAGGVGIRMRANTPKQFLELQGVPILARTLSKFNNHPMVDFIIITLPEKDFDYYRQRVLSLLELDKPARITRGGPTRQASVRNGLAFAQHTDYVAIHDAVRPLVTDAVITQCYLAAEQSGAAVACAEVAETIKKLNGEYIETIPRQGLWLAHTPQTFKTDLITRAHTGAEEDNFEGTDDSVLIERLGHKVSIVPDSNYNIKITTPEDLAFAANLLTLVPPI